MYYEEPKSKERKALDDLLRKRREEIKLKQREIEMEEFKSNKIFWEFQLERAWSRIQYWFDSKNNGHATKHLVEPTIQVTDGYDPIIQKKYQGLWDVETRTISMSYDFIKNYSWDVVLEVLKHEMAHQLVDELYKAGDATLKNEGAHGKLFHRACKDLGVADWAVLAECKDGTRLPKKPWAEKRMDDKRNVLLKKVEKLFSLADSPNENEAKAAMAKAMELLQKHRLNFSEMHDKEGMVACVIPLRVKRAKAYQSEMRSILTSHFGVRIIHFNWDIDVKNKDREESIGMSYEIMGPLESVLMAEYVWHFLTGKLKDLWEVYRTEHKTGAKLSFYYGVVSGFKKKLDEEKERIQEALDLKSIHNQQLIKLESKRLEDFVSSRHPKLSFGSGGGRSIGNWSVYGSGVAQGGAITISKPISRSGGAKGNLLTA